MKNDLRAEPAGFTVIELLVTLAIAAGLLAGFTSFYLSEQRSFRRHQVEIASSQSLRDALEQISRDLRSAGFDPTGSAGAGVTLADVAEVDFTVDANADGTIDASDATEVRKFRRNGGAIESYQGGLAGWVTLATPIVSTGTVFRYYRCDGTEITSLPASAADRAAIARVDVSLSVQGVGGVTLVRTETEGARLRNEACS